MIPLLIVVVAAVVLFTAYRTYGGWLAGRVFGLSADRVCPSEERADGRDYVPTGRLVVFGHHFTSIAGTGPIVGPAIAVIWGWLPALLWVVLGSIFIGAVHDLGALVVSLRNRGQSIGDLAGELVGPRIRLIFMLILVLALTIVLAVFGLVVSSVFRQFPAAIFPCLAQIPIALVIGLLLHRKGAALLVPSVAALLVMYLTVVFGDAGFLHAFNTTLAAMPLWLWTVVLLGYCYVASVLPVWLLLQPRDFINALQLLSVLVLLVLGIAAAAWLGLTGAAPAPAVEAPMVRLAPPGAPAMLPFLFITIACGAVSGFHCLVGSGTSSKQLRCEPDAKFVGYGSMMVEAFLAVLVIVACTAGIGLGVVGADGVMFTGPAAWDARYAGWDQAGTLTATVGSFVAGSANFLQSLGIPAGVAVALMGVFVASFAATTMDTTCRLQRYVLQELFQTAGGGRAAGAVKFLGGVHGATLLAVVLAVALASLPPSGQEWSLENAGRGGIMLWPLFGVTNQLVAGIAFVVIAFYLRAVRKPLFFLVVPGAFMLIMPLWAMLLQVFRGTETNSSWIAAANWPLVVLGLTAVFLEVWLVIEAVRLWRAGGRSASTTTASKN